MFKLNQKLIALVLLPLTHITGTVLHILSAPTQFIELTAPAQSNTSVVGVATDISSFDEGERTIRELKPFELLGISFLSWIIFSTSSDNSLTMIIVAVLASLLIVPHGALDLALARKLNWVKNSSIALTGFFVAYMILAVTFWLIWPYFPHLCLSIFCLMSVVHFGHNDTWKSSSKWVKWSSFLICGTLPLVQSGFWHETEVVSLVAAMIPDEAEVVSHLLKLGGYLWFMGTTLFAMFAIRYEKYHHKLMEIAILVFTFVMLPPELGFLIYGSAIHAPRHIRLNISRAIAAHPSGKRGLIWEILAILLITLILGICALVGNLSLDQDPALIRFIFIGLASLTFPHMLLIDLGATLLERRKIDFRQTLPGVEG